MLEYVASKKKKKKLSIKAKFRILLLILLTIIVLFCVYYFKVVCPIIIKLSEEKVRAVATRTISTVVGDVMVEDGIAYDSLVNITYSSENTVELIEIDTVEINIIIREITKRVQEEFGSLGEEGLNISLGTFTGIPFFFGYGPDIALKLVPVGTVSTRVNSTFTEAGINQTIHRIYFIVQSNIGMVLPAMTQNFTTELEVLLCESIIVGKIPSVYLQGNLI